MKKDTNDQNKGFTIRDIISIIVPVIAIIIIFKLMFLTSVVNSGSMEPTLMTGNVIFFNKLAYVVRDVKRGDIIAFEEEGTNLLIGKRVIGIAGDDISFADGKVVLNGEILDESAYLSEDIFTVCLDTFTVPEGCVFVLGDNRGDSFDSRFWLNPYISIDNIKGKYIGQIDR